MWHIFVSLLQVSYGFDVRGCMCCFSHVTCKYRVFAVSVCFVAADLCSHRATKCCCWSLIGSCWIWRHFLWVFRLRLKMILLVRGGYLFFVFFFATAGFEHRTVDSSGLCALHRFNCCVKMLTMYTERSTRSLTDCKLIFSTTFFWNIFHSKKNWARYDRKCILVFV